MYPDTIVKWHDNSGISVPTEPDYYADAPLYVMVSSFDMGPEDMQVVYGDRFYNLYGFKMNFAKHGQPALQAANCIDGGAKLLLKRIVAPDSLLANIVLCPTLTRKRTAVIADDASDPNAVTYEQAVAILNGAPYVPEESIERVLPEALMESYAVSSYSNGTDVAYDMIMDMVLDTENTPIFPPEENGLQNLTVTSEAGSLDSYSIIAVESYSRPFGNQYLYRFVSEGEDILFPSLDDVCGLSDDGTGSYFVWDERSEIRVPDDAKYIVVVDCKKVGTTYTAYAAGAVVANAKDETMYLIQDNKLVLKWEAVSVAGCKTRQEVVDAVKGYDHKDNWLETDDETGAITINESITLPLIVVSDNGRGVSSKAIKFTPDYVVSRTQSNMFYRVEVFKGTTSLENAGLHTLNPYYIMDNTSYAITPDTSDQVIFDIDDDMYDRYCQFIMDTLDIDKETLLKHDIIFANTNVNTPIEGFTIDPESIDLGAELGIELQNGSNGSFEEAPFGTQMWIDEAVAFFRGENDDAIWDVDMYKAAAVFDANYPEEVKDAIFDFANEREDCYYFRDYGLGVGNYLSIYEKASKYKADFKTSKFVGDYHTTYQIYDPETQKRIRVTMMYDFARCMINHFRLRVAHPAAGAANDMVLPSAIEGTINFTPRKTPKVNQKQLLDDLRVNYAAFNTSGQCIVNTLYTSQTEYTQLSYSNNVLAMQAIVRILRESCPKSRYRLVTSNDFSEYEKDITEVLNNYIEEFEELTFEYTQDPLTAAQKIFYASIYFRFKNWAQTEQFDLYALPVAVEG